MALNPKYMITPNLQELFRNKDTGLPLRAGIVTFYKDQARDELKNVYKLSGTPPDYSYTVLPNPMILGAAGTFVDGSGNDIKVYYYPYDEEGNIELYYITVESSGEVPQFTRQGWPNLTSEEVFQQDLTNYVPNGQFLFHTDIAATATKEAGEIADDETALGWGGWYFVRSTGSAAKDLVTFHRYDSAISNPTGNPRYAVNVQCVTPGNELRKDLVVRFQDVNKFAPPENGIQEYTYAFTAQSNTVNPIAAELYVVKYFGSGGSATEETLISNFSFTDVPQIFQAQFSFGDNVGKTIGSNNDDYVELAIRFPRSVSYNATLTDAILTPNAVTVTQFPATTDSDFSARSDVIRRRANDGSTLYLPLVDTVEGLAYSTADIGKIYASTTDTPEIGELLCNGDQYDPTSRATRANGYIPYSRLWNKWFNLSTNLPKYGTGLDYDTAYVNNLSPASQLRICTNRSSASPPTHVASEGGVATTFTFSDSIAGNDYDFSAYINGANSVLAVGNTLGGSIDGAADVDSGFTITEIRNIAGTYQVFQVVTTAASSITAGHYFTFSNTTTKYYLWFKIAGAGSDPAPAGRTGILVNLPSSSLTAADVAAYVREAIAGVAETTVTCVAASSVTAGAYFYLNSKSATSNPDQFYVLYIKDGSGTDPQPPGKKKITVNILSSDTAAQMASKTQKAINSLYFAVPDFRGLYLRGWDNGAAWDLGAASRFSTVETLYGDVLGTMELDEILAHFHDYTRSDLSGARADGGDAVIAVQLNTQTSIVGGGETRTVNANVNWIVKY